MEGFFRACFQNQWLMERGGVGVNGGKGKVGVIARPHPGLLPRGEGETFPADLKNQSLDWSDG